MPEISVIVPVYKVEPYLRRCVDSILSQTFSDLELILVEDGSPDNCGAICDEYGNADSRVHVIHQENGGLSAARNAGIDWAFAHSDSRWLTFIDSDDWVHPEYLERLLNGAEQTNTAICVCRLCNVSSEEMAKSVAVLPVNPEIRDVEEFLCSEYEHSTIAPTKIYRKELFRLHRYPVGKLHEDAFLTYRIFCQNTEISYIPQPMYFYFQNENGIMHSPWTVKRLDNIDAHKEQVRFFRENGYTAVQQVRSKYFATLICKSLADLKKAEIWDKRLYEKKLKKELRHHLRTTRQFFDLNSEIDRGFFYVAFPLEMKIRRFFLRKIRVIISLWKSAGMKGIMKRFFRR